MWYLLLLSVTILGCRTEDVTWTQFQNTDIHYMVHRPTNGMDYMRAQKYCHKFGGALASIHSKAENDFIQKIAQYGTFTYDWSEMTLIGLERSRSDDTIWSWSDGTKVNFTNWMSGEPNNYEQREDCAAMFTFTEDYSVWNRGGWADLSCKTLVKSIVCRKQIRKDETSVTSVKSSEHESLTSTKADPIFVIHPIKFIIGLGVLIFIYALLVEIKNSKLKKELLKLEIETMKLKTAQKPSCV